MAGDFIGVETEGTVRCISCAEEAFGDDVVALVARTGRQGTFFKAIYVGSSNHDGRTCEGCQTPMNEE